jgi:hypothetical protein
MSVEKLEYPASGSVTNSFEPSLDPEFSGSGEDLDVGIIAEQSAGAQEYRYSEGIQRKIHRRTFRKMPDADRTAFLAFVNAVLGDVFKFTDYASNEHTVSFANFVFTFQPEEGARWSWTIELREEL